VIVKAEANPKPATEMNISPDINKLTQINFFNTQNQLAVMNIIAAIILTHKAIGGWASQHKAKLVESAK
jgi:hypothetical protein